MQSAVYSQIRSFGIVTLPDAQSTLLNIKRLNTVSPSGSDLILYILIVATLSFLKEPPIHLVVFIFSCSRAMLLGHTFSKKNFVQMSLYGSVVYVTRCTYPVFFPAPTF